MSAAPEFLPYGRQAIDEDDIAAVAAALRSDYLTTGPMIQTFETAFAEAVGARFAIVSNSGTAALHLATFAAGVGPGDYCVVPSVTFLATANAVRYMGGEVIFADVDPKTGLMTLETLEAAVQKHKEKKIRAILPVHLNGHSVDMVGLRAMAEKRGMVIIEDACHAIGGRQKTGNGTDAKVGACALSEFACFSLHPVKTVTMGEGGVTTTNDPKAYEAMARFRTHGMIRESKDFRHRALAFDKSGAANPWYYEMQDIGFNYRATDFACALGLSQLKKLDGFARRRDQLRRRYDHLLAPLASRLTPVADPDTGASTLHIYAVLIDFMALGLERAEAMRFLRERGIGTMVHYLPVHMQPYYRDRYGMQSLPGAEAYYGKVLSIPFYPSLTEQQQDQVVTALRALCRL